MEKFVDIIKILETGREPLLISIQKKTFEAVTSDQLNGLMTELINRLKEITHDVRLSEEVPFLELFLGHCYNMLMSPPKAIEHVYRAIEKFKGFNHGYNAALAHWYLGLLHEAGGHLDLCCSELRESARLLSQLERDTALRGNYPVRDKIRELLAKLRKEFDCASHAPFQDNGTNGFLPKKNNEKDTATAFAENYPDLTGNEFKYYPKPLLIPIYYPVVHAYQAAVLAHMGPGVEWVDPPEEESVDISQLNIDERVYSLESVIQGIQKVNLASGKEYGLVRVDGKSMNAFRTPINHGDYVLFYKASDIESSVNKVIIVSRRLERGYIYLVKQLKRRRIIPGHPVEYELVSHTSESGPEYDSALFEQSDGILGEVIAVAKPINGQSRESEQAEVSPNYVNYANQIVFSGSANWRITPEFLFSTLTPYLTALADIQSVINQAQKRPYQEVHISLIKQSSPITVSLDGVSEVVQALREMAVPWRRKHAETMARLEEQEKQLENKKLQLELEQIRIQHAQDLLDTLAPDLSEQERISLLIKLIPPLGEIISSKLEISLPHQA